MERVEPHLLQVWRDAHPEVLCRPSVEQAVHVSWASWMGTQLWNAVPLASGTWCSSSAASGRRGDAAPRADQQAEGGSTTTALSQDEAATRCSSSAGSPPGCGSSGRSSLHKGKSRSPRRPVRQSLGPQPLGLEQGTKGPLLDALLFKDCRTLERLGPQAAVWPPPSPAAGVVTVVKCPGGHEQQLACFARTLSCEDAVAGTAELLAQLLPREERAEAEGTLFRPPLVISHWNCDGVETWSHGIQAAAAVLSAALAMAAPEAQGRGIWDVHTEDVARALTAPPEAYEVGLSPCGSSAW
eukprot:CAMPEP_0117652074 /NCGR_PEP_ID=MMETSP0804-20121206/2434_1 /TAXON_ID=1074897 /ORGANISM="Tetraselmis astigmatica, Strain CCMP880" /LENGTH=297 /DNA_ID=CAMNT_0005458099 /DNA_START=306 /DNA_END=1198 /DNA_ORIENTATION=+